MKSGFIKPECLHQGWQTGGSVRVVRLAFNLYTDGTPSVDDYESRDEQVSECREYSVSDIFCCGYAVYFWQGIRLRYPEYCMPSLGMMTINALACADSVLIPVQEIDKGFLNLMPEFCGNPQVQVQKHCFPRR